MRTSWRSVTAIVERVVDEARAGSDRLGGLERIGIDEKSYRNGLKYLTIVTDHDTGRVVWAAEGRRKETVAAFFDALGTERSRALRLVSADGADWIHTVVKTFAPKAKIWLDPFHVVQWATDAVDGVRRRIAAGLRAAGRGQDAKAMKGTRWAVLKNPETLTGEQNLALASLKKTNDPLYRAYLIKEQLRQVFRVSYRKGRRLLIGVIAWASRSRIPEMVTLGKTLRRFRDLILNSLRHRLSNALAEATNTHIQALIRRSYGFHTAGPSSP
jgi:transposase